MAGAQPDEHDHQGNLFGWVQGILAQALPKTIMDVVDVTCEGEDRPKILIRYATGETYHLTLEKVDG